MPSTSDPLFSALADPTRRALFERLSRDGEQTVRALTDRAGVSRPAVFKHLGVLKQAGLVRAGARDARPTTAPPARSRPRIDRVSLYGAFWRDRVDQLEALLHRIDRQGRKPMLMVSSYAKDYVDACRPKVAAQLASYRQVLAMKPSEIRTFERQFFNHMILALDHYFVHRGRAMEGKDGNPLNEVRLLCDAIMENEGRMSASKTIHYKPETSILKFRAGDEIRLNADDFARLSAAFFDEIETRYP